MILLDANVLIYYLDSTSDHHSNTVDMLQKLVDDDEQLATSHHIIEEVLYAFSKLQSGADLVKVVERISELPNILLVEPAAQMDFAERYAELHSAMSMGINDALLLQLMLDADTSRLFTYDRQFAKRAEKVGITALPQPA